MESPSVTGLGHIALEGGAEFGGKMALPDMRCIELAGGLDVPIVILPTAAVPDNNHQRAGEIGRRWFTSLGATNVQVLPIIDRKTATDPDHARTLLSARLIYILGGFPGYLKDTLYSSSVLAVMRVALITQGAVVAGSSAGAMFLCQYLFDPYVNLVDELLTFVPNACVLPHHNTFGRDWAEQLREAIPHATLIGIDERTGAISGETFDEWTVHGGGNVTLYPPDRPITQPETYRPGDEFTLPENPWVQRFL